jgi:hypothetical protein
MSYKEIVAVVPLLRHDSVLFAYLGWCKKGDLLSFSDELVGFTRRRVAPPARKLFMLRLQNFPKFCSLFFLCVTRTLFLQMAE